MYTDVDCYKTKIRTYLCSDRVYLEKRILNKGRVISLLNIAEVFDNVIWS